MRFIKYIAISFLFGLTALLFNSCSDNAETNTLASQTTMVNSFITSSKLQDSVTYDGNLWYYRFKLGNKTKVEVGDKVTLSYVLSYLASSSYLKLYATNIKSVADLNGLDQSVSYEPITVEVGKSGLFKGFDLGLRYLYEGDGALIMMPSTYAYGSTGIGAVPGNTPVGVRVYVLKVEKK